MTRTVLAVDNSVTMRRLVSYALTQAGYTVVEAIDGRDALDKLRRQKMDLVITDINMPNLDGMHLIKEMRSQPAHKFTPILMLTTESSSDKRRAGQDAGATGWIVKPFETEQLLKAVRRVCP
jgi:two-component system chemotaxis response regulator CheY